jgi:predicted metalloprotease with PDZ domain
MLKAHFISKKFGSFFIGSTFINKNKVVFTVNNQDNKVYNNSNKQYFNTNADVHKLFPYVPKFVEIKEKIKTSIINIFTIIFKNYALSINQLMLLIKLNTRKNILHCDVPTNRKPYLGCSIMATEKGMQIVMIKSESPAEKAKLRVKDIIQEIDGHRITSINEYNAAVGQIANKKTFKILRVESGKEISLDVVVEYTYLD